jgi:acyl-CoA synthetase (NDP forming)
MEFFFKPKSIAVVGASPNQFKGGNAILRNAINGFKGEIYPINPKYQTIEGLPCYPSIKNIPGSVDLAIIFVPAKQVPQVVEDCIDMGIPGALIESAGFAEIGAAGEKLQQQLIKIAAKSSIRLWGPNCMGLVDAVNGHVFSFMVPEALKGGLIPGYVSLIVQSGMLSGGFLMDIISNRITGINKVCSVGNKIDVDECDLLEYMAGDPQTKVIGLYLESIVDGRRFIDLCRKISKPIVVLKGGKSASGAQAAMSHTASLAGNHRVIEGALAQVGVSEAKDFKQMVDICRSLAVYPKRPAGMGRVAILTASGGAGIVASDFIDEFNLSLAEFSAPTKKALQKLFPDWMPVKNPVDVWPALEANMGMGVDVFKEALKALFSDPGVDAILISGFAGNSSVSFDMADIAEASRLSGKPAFIWLFGLRDAAFQVQTEARLHGVPVFQELNRTVDCLATVLHQKKKNGALMTKAVELSRSELPKDLHQIMETAHGPLDEHISKRILRTCGIPAVAEKIVLTPDECLVAADKIGYPLVMKGILSRGTHKTEMGLVHLGIGDKQAAGKTFQALMEKMEHRGAVLLQKQMEGKVELILGMLRDPHFGPSVMLGIGGIMAEAFSETVFAVAPLSLEDALDLIDRFPAQKLLSGFRGTPPLDRKKFAAVLIALGNIGLFYPRIKEVDINPMILTASGAVAVDATIVLD